MRISVGSLSRGPLTNAILIATATLCFGSAQGAIRDPSHPTKHPVLVVLVPILDSHDIDVVLGDAMTFPAGERPRIARLSVGVRAAIDSPEKGPTDSLAREVA